MVLERTNRVELRPTIQALFDTINSVTRNLIVVLQAVPRVALQLTDKQRRDLEVGQRVQNAPIWCITPSCCASLCLASAVAPYFTGIRSGVQFTDCWLLHAPPATGVWRRAAQAAPHAVRDHQRGRGRSAQDHHADHVGHHVHHRQDAGVPDVLGEEVPARVGGGPGRLHPALREGAEAAVVLRRRHLPLPAGGVQLQLCPMLGCKVV